MVLNLSVRINEAQTKEMVGAKREFYFKFIEQKVVALRYQVAQERNIEVKNPKKDCWWRKNFCTERKL